MIDLQSWELRKGLCPAAICSREEHTRAVRKSLLLNRIAVVMREVFSMKKRHHWSSCPGCFDYRAGWDL